MTNQPQETHLSLKRSLVLILSVMLALSSFQILVAKATGGSKAFTNNITSGGVPHVRFDRGKKQTIWKEPTELIIFFDQEKKVSKKQAGLIIKKTLGKKAKLLKHNSFAAVVKAPNDISVKKAVRKLQKNSKIKEASPVFYKGKRSEHKRLALTGDIVVEFYLKQNKKQLNDIANLHDLRLVRQPQFAGNTYIFKSRGAGESLDIANELQSIPSVKYAYPNWYKTMAQRAVPDDPLYPGQWHLKNTGQGGFGTAGNDVNIESVWDSNKSSPNEVIAVVDDGVEINHEDLSSNILNAYNWDWVGNDSNPSPGPYETHGTAVAGVAAARGFNAIGVAGAAPEAGLVGYRLSGANTDVNEALAMSKNQDIVDISNNSWGPPDDGQTLERPGPLLENAFKDGVTNGRQGKGTVYVWAGGNGREYKDNSNYDGYANSRYTIAVGASDNYGEQSSYSEDGANILVNAPSNGGSLGISTTDLSGINGASTNGYQTNFGGTSSATPLVSGVIALILRENPDLTWRDVQQILMKSAYKNDPSHADWTTNGAGYPINHSYGFGRIDAQTAVTMATNWEIAGNEVTVQNSASPNLPIPDNNSTGVASTLNISANLNVEYAEVFFSATNHSWWGDLEITLESPSGTKSVLSERHNSGSEYVYDNWRFGSVRHFGEGSQGEWKLTVKDLETGSTGTFQSWQLKLYGTQQNTGPDSEAPTTSISLSSPANVPGWHKTKPEITLNSNEEGVTRYSWDSPTGPWIEYEGPFPAPEGTNTLYYFSEDPSLNAETPRSQLFKVDTVKPASTLTAPQYSSDISTKNEVNFSWNGTDPLPRSGIANYDVAVKANANGKWVIDSGLDFNNGWFAGSAGTTYYLKSRAIDTAGNEGAWSATRTTIVPYDQGVFGYSGAWNSVYYSKLLKGSAKYTSIKDRTASVRFSNAKSVGLIITKRPNAGYADVYIGSAKIKTINFYSSTVKYRIPVLIKSYLTTGSGTLKVVVKGTKSMSSKGYRVEIDGFAVKK